VCSSDLLGFVTMSLGFNLIEAYRPSIVLLGLCCLSCLARDSEGGSSEDFDQQDYPVSAGDRLRT